MNARACLHVGCAALLLVCSAPSGLAQEPAAPSDSPKPIPLPAEAPRAAPRQRVPLVVQEVKAAQDQPTYYDAADDIMVPVITPPGAQRAAAAPAPAPVPAPAQAVVPAPARSGYYDRARDVYVPADLPPATYPAPSAAPRELRQDFGFVVRGGRLVAGPLNSLVRLGTVVSLTIDSDTDDLLTLDGYGLAIHLMPGQPVLLSFTAERPGRFTYRLARSGNVLGVIEVGPSAQNPG